FVESEVIDLNHLASDLLGFGDAIEFLLRDHAFRQSGLVKLRGRLLDENLLSHGFADFGTRRFALNAELERTLEPGHLIALQVLGNENPLSQSLPLLAGSLNHLRQSKIQRVRRTSAHRIHGVIPADRAAVEPAQNRSIDRSENSVECDL